MKSQTARMLRHRNFKRTGWRSKVRTTDPFSPLQATPAGLISNASTTIHPALKRTGRVAVQTPNGQAAWPFEDETDRPRGRSSASFRSREGASECRTCWNRGAATTYGPIQALNDLATQHCSWGWSGNEPRRRPLSNRCVEQFESVRPLTWTAESAAAEPPARRVLTWAAGLAASRERCTKLLGQRDGARNARDGRNDEMRRGVNDGERLIRCNEQPASIRTKR